MPLPVPINRSPLNSQQSEWLRDRALIDGAPIPPPIQTWWQLNDGTDNAWILNDGTDNAWLINT